MLLRLSVVNDNWRVAKIDGAAFARIPRLQPWQLATRLRYISSPNMTSDTAEWSIDLNFVVTFRLEIAPTIGPRCQDLPP
jgi:hypothetical protein